MTSFDRIAVRDTMVSAMASLLLSFVLVGAAVLPAQPVAAAIAGL